MSMLDVHDYEHAIEDIQNRWCSSMLLRAQATAYWKLSVHGCTIPTTVRHAGSLCTQGNSRDECVGASTTVTNPHALHSCVLSVCAHCVQVRRIYYHKDRPAEARHMWCIPCLAQADGQTYK